ncbi:MAG: tetratricopeptide repeat protein [Gemmataceae bacterium]
MHGRSLGTLMLGAALALATGCTSNIPLLRSQPSSAPTATSAAASPTAVKESVTHSASTYVAFGDMIAPAAVAEDKTLQQRQAARDEARLSYLKALEVDPKFLPAHLALARLLEKTQDATGAMAAYSKALEIDPQNPQVWHALGLCQARQKQWNESVDSLRKACDLSPGNQTYVTTLGYTLGRAGRLQEALPLLAQTMGEAKAHYDLARLMKHLNQPTTARDLAMVAVARDPNLQGLKEFLLELTTPTPKTPGKLPPVIQQVAYTPPQSGDPAETTGPDEVAPGQHPAPMILGSKSGTLVSDPTGPAPIEATSPVSEREIPQPAMRMPPLPIIRKTAR